MTNNHNKMGRRTKLNPELHAEIVELIKAGNYIETACAVAGISKSTFYEWMKKGKVHDRRNMYRRFRDAVLKAKAWSEARDVGIIAKQAETHWKASAWRLERMYPKRWSKQRKEVEPLFIMDFNDFGTESPECIETDVTDFMENKEVGRPTKLTLTVHEEIVKLIKEGNYVETAREFADIPKSTFNVWMKKGEITGRNNKYTRFFAEFEKAKAWSEARDVSIIAQHSEKNWKAAAWKLERKHSKRWGKQRRILEPPVITDDNFSDSHSPEQIACCVKKVLKEKAKKQEESNTGT